MRGPTRLKSAIQCATNTRSIEVGMEEQELAYNTLVGASSQALKVRQSNKQTDDCVNATHQALI
jgi:hypothetical protein